jgi:hypothetical protein
LALFLTIVCGQGHRNVPGDRGAGLGGADLSLHRFRLLEPHRRAPGEDQIWRAGAEVFLAASLVVFTYTYLHLNRWHVRYSHLTIGWLGARPASASRCRAVGRR